MTSKLVPAMFPCFVQADLVLGRLTVDAIGSFGWGSTIGGAWQQVTATTMNMSMMTSSPQKTRI